MKKIISGITLLCGLACAATGWAAEGGVTSAATVAKTATAMGAAQSSMGAKTSETTQAKTMAEKSAALEAAKQKMAGPEVGADDAAPKDAIRNDDSHLNSEFQSFVAQSVGQVLPMYGYNLFNGAPNTFAPVDHIPVTADYAIGPGDELLVHIWGQIEVSQGFVVDRNGLINIPKVGPVNVVGVKYQNLQAHLKHAISKMFRNFELDVSLGKLRSIQVFVVGQAARPGSYTVSSLSTLVNALFATGGPSAKGSMRHIQLKRGNKVVTTFDLYDLLLKGDKSNDVALLPGDVIYIPTVGPLAAISGSVNTPAIFELKDKESLAGLIELAGGLTNVAAGQKVSVERIHEREMRKVAEFQLDQEGLSKALQDGDLIKVYAISARFDNAVTLKGNIANPGRHPWRDGLRISDIIPDKSALITDYYWLKQNQAEKIDVGSADKLRTEVKRTLPEINWDYAVVERLNTKDLTTSLIPFNLSRAIIERDAEQNMLLQPGDVITIFSKDDIQVSADKRTKYVVLEGELERPGVYQALPGETLRQLVGRVGGVSPQAYLMGAEFTRESTRQMQQRRMDEIVAKMEADMQRVSSAAASSATAVQDVEAAKVQVQAQQVLINKMKQVRATGRIVLEIPEQQAQVKDLPDLVLEDGDRFHVPHMPSTVQVMGTVYNQNAFIFKSGLSVGDYLNKAGGPTGDANTNEIYLVRADGKVWSKRQSNILLGISLGGFTSKEVLPGDTVIVPEQLEKYNFTKDFKDWTQIFYQFAVGVASVKALDVF